MRKLVERDGMLIDLNDSRLKIFPGEKVLEKQVRFRTLGCYPLTGAVESNATTLDEIVLELIKSTSSERQGGLLIRMKMLLWSKKRRKGIFRDV